uniref:Peptidase A2 domain-containing protein n=1 Tax=Glossina austeni TaxID=7395 RepID=A0A1A9UWK7_GLOAU
MQAEAQCASKGGTQDTTKYENVLTALAQGTILSVLDYIRDPPAVNKFKNLMKILIERRSLKIHVNSIAKAIDNGIFECTISRLFGKNNILKYLIDNGAEISVLPAIKLSDKMNSFDISFTTANGSSIRTYGKNLLNLDINLRREFRFAFLIAEVLRPIIGAVFLRKYGILIDITNKQLFTLPARDLAATRIWGGTPMKDNEYRLVDLRQCGNKLNRNIQFESCSIMPLCVPLSGFALISRFVALMTIGICASSEFSVVVSSPDHVASLLGDNHNRVYSNV